MPEMDKIQRLQALLGDVALTDVADFADKAEEVEPAVVEENPVDTKQEPDDVKEEIPFQPFMFPSVRSRHIYEGTDSEDDEYITSGGHVDTKERATAPAHVPSKPAKVEFSEFKDYHHLQLGQLAAEGESFCPFQTIKKYPYVYIGVSNRQRVVEAYFDKGQVYNRAWDFFYLHRLTADPNQQPIVLVPTSQFEYFLSTINSKLDTYLSIPSGGASGGFKVSFKLDGAPHPRYLGRSTNRVEAEELRVGIPPRDYRPAGELAESEDLSEKALIAFKAKIELITKAQKGKKLANKEKQKTERVAKQQSWNHAIKRVQRYLGIRDIRRGHHAAIRQSLGSSGLEWAAYDEAVNAAAAELPPATIFDPQTPVTFNQEGSVIFVCIDVEAYERNANLITEIGVATLDTADITTMAPGIDGESWRKAIRARHFRINEYKYLINHEFVDGCPDRFEFGTSEFISIKDAPQIVSTCFNPPFSGPASDNKLEDQPKRNIILVGHDLGADINFLRSIGYELNNLSNIQETVDTSTMWRYLKRDTNIRNLGSILAELGIVGWNLHNAGNDAVYTLYAMLGIAIKGLEKAEGPKEHQEDGWSSGGNNSDGGAPIPQRGNS
ncbi:hypothetical protein B7494_g5779 [Chlorociboria aeruginascens]|nr:hypothetical protein B7494_g5779 [Chlorociboria aeruginascens]